MNILRQLEMIRTVTFLTLISQLQYATTNLGTCVAHKQFFLNGLICTCDSRGRWTDASCVRVNRRQNCQPGKVIWQGCSQCICQETGQFICNFVSCPDNSAMLPTTKKDGLSSIGAWCTPFRIYYVDCSICVCPASGRVAEAHCAKDTACLVTTPSSSNVLVSVNKNHCLPNVMYLFSCLQCLCSEDGYFVLNNCVETCPPKVAVPDSRKCKPRTYYRKNCNVCFCPDDMIPNDKYCTQEVCNGTNMLKILNVMRTKPSNCIPYQFTQSRCLYCDCGPQETVNEQACIELYCLQFNNSDYKVTKNTCYPGEMVPVCTECFCLRNGSTLSEYCTKGCTFKNKLNVLEKVFKVRNRDQLVDMQVLDKNSIVQRCRPNSVYIENNSYCLCPDDGSIDKRSCIPVAPKEFNFSDPSSEFVFKEHKLSINFNATCEPSTFVEFDCNTCFCSKNATIDPKWCTYDDCEAIKSVQIAQKAETHTKADNSTECTPGSITNLGCNFCICPGSGRVKDMVCTVNKCTSTQPSDLGDKFNCEPLSYYEVDCNICYCPRDGQKNVARCTKNLCEKTFLRSDLCTPGKLFSHECNVCVCPLNGNKADKACTEHNCHRSATAWKSIYKLSNSVLGGQLSEDTTRKLDLCFPGEEFRVDCHLCVCPEMGLKTYAACTNMFCDDAKDLSNRDESNTDTWYNVNKTLDLDDHVIDQARRAEIDKSNGCFVNNFTDSAERKECTPGSMYIIRCRQCICPYLGNINNYCRPLKRDQYCEQAYPGINYLPMGRREGISEEGLDDDTKSTTEADKSKIPLASHLHTFYKCEKPGRVVDNCYNCECGEDYKIVKQHCFLSEATECIGRDATFLKDIIPNV